ncbi:hypothetical protein FTO70_14600 [Methanosarcina sp. KYL-1]|uniref:C15orf41 family protein n=1 Tax=Methanosarcina sp. KYL-1 TaxID=2602068 RepID=UPI002101572D|nr:C15orf41 family protein [Methanosarcina sp. KYL-1]MCQ1536878.1 hypothetical protein [Methanosarcina sp. KYL-1]
MDRETYREIYDSLYDFKDVFRLSEQYSEPVGMLATILNQKIVKMTRFRHRKVYSREEELFFKWRKGRPVLDLAEYVHFPPTLMASLIMKNLGFPKKTVNWFFKNPDSIEHPRLRKEIKKALEADHFFSPQAHEMQCKKGEMGEAVIQKWLDDREIPYCTEAEIRAQGEGKTPDFVLKIPVCIEGMTIKWIESKALFGDEFEHQQYSKKQFKEYSEIFGEGMVVYWYGCLDDLPADGYLVKDYSFFEEYGEEIKGLFDYLVYW